MLRPVPLASSSAIVAALLYVLCAIFAAVAPGIYLAVLRSWFHGVQLPTLAGAGMSAGGLILGITTLVAAAWVSAAALAALYNRLGGR
jgi:hypothetical protein